MKIGDVVLDRFVIEQELGSGAMGTVYRGRHVKHGRDVAIKVMHEHLATEPVLIARFRREAMACGRLGHPNIVGILDFGQDATGLPVLVMEYVSGTPLSELMPKLMTRERIFGLLRQILDGLDHAHAQGIIHRDLKPDNVLVEAGDHVRIVDFGIAVLRGGDDDMQRLTGTGVIIGTPLYMSPEQAKGEPIDQRADLYALGMILYELLSGKQPFYGTSMEVATMKIDHDPPPIANLDPLHAKFLHRLIARVPDERFASAKIAAEILLLMTSDPQEAASRMGIIDVARSLSTIALPKID
jgi:serine/threonine protein kinase